ncbi:uncharacterized protein GLRG_05670 [Colletotrichum graminicola M1.001]|uniref:PI-PLC Y-box domain-containing protein n=1 Tax=Colletotrichum graminicola (strain M1.001 / M2 / FGSC 10212) TaxID=645133 RepID=E3QI38_COLGM|nr:uncharacterized protein GLRG_05670 [Colletotrichum graminicola M1.001]EFQ30526.1 hypothetical protein GLRG_05670 [Colletotrichum graminicola M1.001]
MEVTSLANTALKLSATSGGYQLSATSTVANKASRIVPRGMRVMDKRYGPSPLGYPGCAVLKVSQWEGFRADLTAKSTEKALHLQASEIPRAS